jgi:long-chain acyl-CoA synthetase
MQSLPQFFEKSVENFPDNIYLWENIEGKYIGTTYLQTREFVHRFAAGLMSLGVKKGDRICLMSEGRNAWVICELGIFYTGAINVPLSTRLSEPEELRFRLKHSGTWIAIVSGRQADKIRGIKAILPSLEKLIILDDDNFSNPDELSYNQLLMAGESYLKENKEIFENTWQAVKPGDEANICYTSGTTADPKGVVLTHHNYLANIQQAYSLMDLSEDSCSLLTLSWDHAFTHTAGLYCFMGKGASIASVQQGLTVLESLRNIPENLKQVQPNILFSVPAMAANFRKKIESEIRSKGKFAESFFHHALKIAYIYNGIGWDKGKGFRFLLRPLIGFYDILIFRQIRNIFGGRLNFFLGGGALLDIEFQRFFYAIGIPMFQGYGLTEASPIISSNSKSHHKLGSSGYLVTNLQLRICGDKGEILPTGNQGEIVVQGDNIMKKYYNNDIATSDTIRDGWLHTGDLGYMDKDGFLYVLGRFKSLLIADDGEKFSPEGMEEAIAGESSFIDQCLLYNNQNPYTVALVVPNREALLLHLRQHDLKADSDEGQTEALTKIHACFNEYRKGGRYQAMFPERWLPSAIAILNEAFTEENHQLNSLLKMVRGKIIELHASQIQFLYTPEARNFYNRYNLDIIKTILK